MKGNRSKKRQMCIALAIVLVCLLAACKKAENQADHNHEQTASVILRVALMAGNDEPHYKAVQRFKQEVEGKSENKVRVSIFESGKLGSEATTLEHLANEEDKVDIVIADVKNLTKYEETIDLCTIPFAFQSYEDARRFMDDDIQSRIEKELSAHNMRVLAHYTNGFRYVVSNKKQVSEANDLQSLLIATTEDDYGTLAIRIAGAMTKTVPMSEVTERIRQGSTDGYEGTLTEIYYNRLYSRSKYIVETNHTYSASCFVIAESVFHKLDQETQKIVKEAAQASARTDYETQQMHDSEMLAEIETSGVRVCRPALNRFWEKAETYIGNTSSKYEDLIHEFIMWKKGR